MNYYTQLALASTFVKAAAARGMQVSKFFNRITNEPSHLRPNIKPHLEQPTVKFHMPNQGMHEDSLANITRYNPSMMSQAMTRSPFKPVQYGPQGVYSAESVAQINAGIDPIRQAMARALKAIRADHRALIHNRRAPSFDTNSVLGALHT